MRKVCKEFKLTQSRIDRQIPKFILFEFDGVGERERQGTDKKEKRNKEIKQGTRRGRRGEDEHAKLPV